MDDQQQQFLFPGDLGMQFVTDLDQQVLWGAADTSIVPTGNSAGGFQGNPLGGGRQIF